MSAAEFTSVQSLSNAHAGRRRVWRLVGWWAAIGVSLGVFWLTGASQDYKNTAAVVALVAGCIGTSFWTLRNAGGRRIQRWRRALLVWIPLWVVSPLGPVQLINNGNVGVAGWRWRWSQRPDELLPEASAAVPSIDWRTSAWDYPAFLGGGHWAEVKGVRIAPDWSQRPPKLLWRQPIGAGWSGFAVVGDYAITQEQRGSNELVVCYEARTGRVAWSHKDAVRWDPGGSGALGGVGPRATPTAFDGRVYTHGATGILNCLDARTGRKLWSHDTLAEEHAVNVMWGKACSPIVVDDWIVVSVGGARNNSLVAYDRKDGRRIWGAGKRVSSYATPVLATLCGVRQIVVVNQDFVTSHRASDGGVLWEHRWRGNSGMNASASQPTPLGGDRVLLTKGYGVPAEVVHVERSDRGAWTVDVAWRKPVLRTKMSNVLVRDNYAYAIGDVDLECVDLNNGRRTWKSRRRPRVGNGQILLVDNAILALTESGEVMLVEASPKRFRELATLHALEGVTWNTPALAGSLLLVRNSSEAACYEMPLAASAPQDSTVARAR